MSIKARAEILQQLMILREKSKLIQIRLSKSDADTDA